MAVISIKQFLAQVRDALGYPPVSRLNDATILMRTYEKQEHYRNELKLSQENWIVDYWDMHVDANRDDMAVAATNSEFGEPYLIETIDTGDVNHVRREIPIVKMQDIDQKYEGPNTAQGSLGYPHVAACFAFYNRDGEWRVRWKPMHNQAATYRNWYKPGLSAFPLLNDNVMAQLSSQTNVVRADVSLSCWPMILDDDTAPTAKQLAMRDEITRSLGDYREQFEMVRHLARGEQTGRRRMWADRSRRSGDDY